MTENGESRKAKPEPGAKEEPQVYGVEKDLTGWRFGRRAFVTAAAAAGVAAATGAAVAGRSKEAVQQAEEDLGSAITLAVAMPAMRAVMPGAAFVQAWKFTNNSDTTWCRGASLHIVDGEQLQAPASMPVPDIAPGETVGVQVGMVAPADLGTYRGSWHLQVAGNVVPVSYGPFVVQNGCIAESAHNYGNNADQTWTVTNPDENAGSTRVHFTRVEMTSGDYVILKDEGGVEYQRITGYYTSGLWSDPVPGRVVEVQLVTNASGTAWGFCLDQVETVHLVYLPFMSRQPTPTPSPTPCPCDIHYCTCDTVHYWYPC
jgi:hypothetical protein